MLQPDLVDSLVELKPAAWLSPLDIRTATLKAEGLTHRQIGTLEGRSRSAIRQRMRRARRRAELLGLAPAKYSKALAGEGQATKRMRPFSLLPTDHV